MLGLHWIADASGCAPGRVTREALRQLLHDLPERLGLTRIGEPQLFEHAPQGGGEATIAGIVLLAESHVSVHAVPAECTVHIDVFSCKPMNAGAARDYVTAFFGAAHLSEWVLERGGSTA